MLHDPRDPKDDLDGGLDDLEAALADSMEIDHELAEAGIDAHALARRAEALLVETEGAKAVSVLHFPPWVHNWEVQLAAASGSYHDAWLSVDVHGLPAAVRLKLEPRRSGTGPGSVIVSWAADFYDPAGLVIELFRKDDPQDQPSFACRLGPKARGTLALTAGMVGFDPTITPFQCRLRRPQE